MIIDPGIGIDKGYPAYDRGIEQDVFFKVCVNLHMRHARVYSTLKLYTLNYMHIIITGLQWEQLCW